MTLRRKTLLISTLATLILASGFYIVAALIQAHGIAQIERSQIRGGVARVWQALAREIEDLQSTAGSYTENIDPVAAASDAGQRRLNTTFSDDVLRGMRVDVVVLLNSAGQIAFAKRRFTPATRNAPHESLEEFAKAVFTRSEPTSGASGYFALPEHFLMFAAQPLSPNEAGAPRGTLVFGRDMNDEALLRLNQTTQLTIKMHRADDPMPTDFRDARAALIDAKDNLVTVNVNDEIAASYAMVTDVADAPAAILRMEAARTSHELGTASTRYLLWALLVAGLTLATANVWIVDRLVLARMTVLGRDVDRIAQNREFEARLRRFGNDELAGLALRVNELLAALHSQHDLEQALVAAQDASRAKSVFLANMSHELRTPLNAIIGYSELLAEDPAGQGQVEDLKRIVEASHHLQNIISDVLDLAKIEAGKVELNYAPFSLRNALNMVRDVIQLRAREKNLTLSIEMPDDVPDDFTGDVLRLRQIMLNLLNNAVKYTAQGRVELVLSARKLPGFPAARVGGEYYEIQFAVRDTGMGIPADQLKSLFKPFNRVESPTNRRLGGAGLGLALSKQLCELMGGRMWAHSQENKGSEFFFTIVVEAIAARSGVKIANGFFAL